MIIPHIIFAFWLSDAKIFETIIRIELRRSSLLIVCSPFKKLVVRQALASILPGHAVFNPRHISVIQVAQKSLAWLNKSARNCLLLRDPLILSLI